MHRAIGVAFRWEHAPPAVVVPDARTCIAPSEWRSDGSMRRLPSSPLTHGHAERHRSRVPMGGFAACLLVTETSLLAKYAIGARLAGEDRSRRRLPNGALPPVLRVNSGVKRKQN